MRRFESAAIISNDGDLKMPIQIVREELDLPVTVGAPLHAVALSGRRRPRFRPPPHRQRARSPGLVRRYKMALKAGGVREVRFNDLRHTFGTRMVAAGVPMRTLQGWMGHRDIKTTLIYADYAPSDRERAMVGAAFSPEASPGDR